MHFLISFLQILLIQYAYSLTLEEESVQLVHGSSTDHRENLGSTEEFQSINQKSFNKANQYVFLNYCCWLIHDLGLGQIDKQHYVHKRDVVSLIQTYQIYHPIVDTNAKHSSLLMKFLISQGTYKNCVCRAKINHMTKKDKNLFMTCRNFNGSELKRFICDNLKQRNKDKLSNSVIFKSRNLLQYPSRTKNDPKQNSDEVIQLWIGGVDGKPYIVNNSTFIGLSAQQWKEFLTALRVKTSRDHVWAMLCLVGLVFIMVAGMKLCGLKTINRQHEIYQEYMFRDSSHTVSIKEILALKRPYLPKGLVRFQKRWRGKSRKKPMKEIIEERDIADPMSDNSDEERLIYSQPIIDL